MFFFFLILPACKKGGIGQTAVPFSTSGHTVYHLETANTGMGESRAIVSAAYDGMVQCHSPGGDLIWERSLNGYFPYDLATADIDNDGRDEVLVATAGGTLDVLDPDGESLWTFSTEAILYQVCPVKTPSGEWRIFTGGIGERIYVLDHRGNLMDSLPAGDVVRHMRSGMIRGDGREYVAVATTSSARSGILSLMLIDPSENRQVWRTSNLGKRSTGQARRRFFNHLLHGIRYH